MILALAFRFGFARVFLTPAFSGICQASVQDTVPRQGLDLRILRILAVRATKDRGEVTMQIAHGHGPPRRMSYHVTTLLRSNKWESWTKKMLGNTLAMLMVFLNGLHTFNLVAATYKAHDISQSLWSNAFIWRVQVVCLWNVSWYPNMGRPWTHYNVWGVGWTSQPQLLDQFDHTQFQGSLVLTFRKRHWSLGIDEFQKDSTGKRIFHDFGRSWVLIVERWFGWVQRMNATP